MPLCRTTLLSAHTRLARLRSSLRECRTTLCVGECARFVLYIYIILHKMTLPMQRKEFECIMRHHGQTLRCAAQKFSHFGCGVVTGLREVYILVYIVSTSAHPRAKYLNAMVTTEFRRQTPHTYDWCVCASVIQFSGMFSAHIERVNTCT